MYINTHIYIHTYIHIYVRTHKYINTSCWVYLCYSYICFEGWPLVLDTPLEDPPQRTLILPRGDSLTASNSSSRDLMSVLPPMLAHQLVWSSFKSFLGNHTKSSWAELPRRYTLSACSSNNQRKGRHEIKRGRHINMGNNTWVWYTCMNFKKIIKAKEFLSHEDLTECFPNGF